MHVSTLDPLGARITGLSVADVDAGVVPFLRDLLARHGVVVLAGQDIDDDDFVTFLRRFGPLAFTVGETPVPGHPDLNVVSNVGRATPPRSTFHTDSSYFRSPPAYTALRAVQIPERGGATLFTDQYRAFDTLDPSLRRRLEGRTIRHVVTGVDPGEGAETWADHPVFRRHPRSGRTALFLSTPARCAAISGMGDGEAAEVVAALFAHSTQEAATYRHRWAPGDVVMWDNACVLHRADHADVSGDRVMHRGMVAGPAAAAA